MKNIYLNLKRFDIPTSLDGINNNFTNETYGEDITKGIEDMHLDIPITIYFQESNLISAKKAAKEIRIGCQGVHYADVSKGGNFGAFTTSRTAKSMAAIGVKDALIGHCEERNHLNYLTSLGGNKVDINEILNKEVKCAIDAGMNVLYCIGEKLEEQGDKYNVLKNQIEAGLKDVSLSKVTIAYEPVWAIGPGRTPPDKDYIEDIVKFIKSVKDVRVVYGGGLKIDNAKMLASIKELDGGLIALTRFGADFGFYLDDFKKIVETYKEGLK